MYNATNLTYRASNIEVEECEEWIEENINGLHQIRTSALDSGTKRTFVFKKKSDAMAFKLVWEGKLMGIIK